MSKRLSAIFLCFMIVLSQMTYTSSASSRMRSLLKGEKGVRDQIKKNLDHHTISMIETSERIKKLHDNQANSDCIQLDEALIEHHKNLKEHENLVKDAEAKLKTTTDPEEKKSIEDFLNTMKKNVEELKATIKNHIKDLKDEADFKKKAEEHELSRENHVRLANEEALHLEELARGKAEVDLLVSSTPEGGELQEVENESEGGETPVNGQVTDFVQSKSRKMNTFQVEAPKSTLPANTKVGVKLANSCIAGLFANIPPSFCYKKGADAGIFHFYADGYFQRLAMFYKYCNSGYTEVAGVCWQNCNGGYTDFGATCTRCWWSTCGGWFKFPCLQCHTYWKHSYITTQLTAFDGRVRCRDDWMYYKWGALCYRRCERDNSAMVNCGIGACAASTEACIAGIISMIAEVILAVTTFVVFVLSFGTSGAGAGQAAGKTGRTLIQKAGSKAKRAFDFCKKIAQNQAFRKALIDKAKKWAYQKAIKEGITGVAQATVEQICAQVGNQIFDKVQNSNSFNIADYDPTGIANSVQTCNDPNQQSQMCAKAIMDVVSMIDPTGLVALAGALIQPVCDK